MIKLKNVSNVSENVLIHEFENHIFYKSKENHHLIFSDDINKLILHNKSNIHDESLIKLDILSSLISLNFALKHDIIIRYFYFIQYFS
jgi:hypothetical protein